MRLIRAYIAGFGRLTDFRIDYERGLTALCMENGWGKTTLAYFHKAIFYGLDSTGKLKGDIKERERYKPWTSAPFGGWLEFAVDSPEGEKAYRIERDFGDKPAKDHFRLFTLPDLRPSADFADPVGLELFELNAAGFIRTVFATGTLHTPPQTPDSGLLAERFGENPADNVQLGAAIAKLEARRVELQTRRGDNGKVPDLRREIYAIERQIDDCRAAADRAEQHRRRLSDIGERIARDEAELLEIREKINRHAEKQANAARLDHYRGLLNRVEILEKEKSVEEEFFRNAPYSEEDLNLMQKTADERRLAAEYAKQAARPFECEQEYADLSARFRSGLPDEEAIRDYAEIEQKLAFGRRREQEIRESAEYLRLSERFSERVPDEETVDRMIEKQEAFLRKSGIELPAKIALIPGCVFLISILGCLLSAGILRGIFIGLMAISGIALIVSALILSRKVKPKDDSLADFMNDFDLLEYDGDLLSGLHRLRSDLALYRSNREKLAAQSKENQTLSAELSEFLEYYHAPNLKVLEDWVKRYIELERTRKSHLDRAETARAKADEQSDRMAALLSRYPIDSADPEAAIAEIRSHGAALAAKARSITDARRDAEQYAEQYKSALTSASADQSDDRSDLSLDDLGRREAEISAHRERCKDEAREVQNALQSCTEAADRMLLLQEELQRKREQSEQAIAALLAIERAEALLTQANQNLSDRYLTVVQESFAGYLQKLMPTADESARYHMDGSLSVLSEEAGKQRTSGLLSTGKQDLAALCARLALADALMDGKPHFLILDDPFTNLDDGRVKSALALLCEMAKDRQILYLTCSQSRMPVGTAK